MTITDLRYHSMLTAHDLRRSRLRNADSSRFDLESSGSERAVTGGQTARRLPPSSRGRLTATGSTHWTPAALCGPDGGFACCETRALFFESILLIVR